MTNRLFAGGVSANADALSLPTYQHALNIKKFVLNTAYFKNCINF